MSLHLHTRPSLLGIWYCQRLAPFCRSCVVFFFLFVLLTSMILGLECLFLLTENKSKGNGETFVLGLDPPFYKKTGGLFMYPPLPS